MNFNPKWMSETVRDLILGNDRLAHYIFALHDALLESGCEDPRSINFVTMWQDVRDDLSVIATHIKVWRAGFAHQMPDDVLEAMEFGLLIDDPAIIQGNTSSPQPPHGNWGGLCQSTDITCYGFWRKGGLETIGDIETKFSELCYEADEKLGEPAFCRWYLNWVDSCPRDEMFSVMLREVRLEQDKRLWAAGVTGPSSPERETVPAQS